MQRRNFIKTSSLAGLTLSAVNLGACKVPPSEQKQQGAAANKGTDDFVLNEATIDMLQQKMQSK